MKVRTLPSADVDVTDAGDRLDGKRTGLGLQFALEFEKAVAAIGSNPEMYARTEDGPDEPENREYVIARFG